MDADRSFGGLFHPSHQISGVSVAALGLRLAPVPISARLCFVARIPVDVIGVEFGQRSCVPAESAIEADIWIFDAGAKGHPKGALSEEMEVDDKSPLHRSLELFGITGRFADLGAEGRGFHRRPPDRARIENSVSRTRKNYISGLAYSSSRKRQMDRFEQKGIHTPPAWTSA